MSTTAPPSSTNANSNPTSNIRVVSYNVLSSKLSRSDHFTHADPEHLDFEYRLPLILKKLEDEMERGFGDGGEKIDTKRGSDYIGEVDPGEGKQVETNTNDGEEQGKEKSNDHKSKETQPPPPTIFCLQEVCYPFASALHAFFARKGYHFVTGLYGKKFNGYMGIGIAYPFQHFETISVDIARLSDEREGGWPRPPPEDDDDNAVGKKIDTKTSKRLSPEKLQVAIENGHPIRLQDILRKLTESFEKFTAHTVNSTVEFVRNHIDKPLGVKFRRSLGLPPLEKEGEEDKLIDPWDMSENRFNVLVSLVLRCRGKDEGTKGMFSITNYHMPCAFYAPPVMNIHAEMAARRVQSLAARAWKDVNASESDDNHNDDSNDNNLSKPSSIPYILTGDYNILPESAHYKLLTTGTLDKDDPTYPPSKHGMEWTIGSVAMDSAYALKHQSGSEPEFTNYAHTGEQEEPFVGTLDYIFLSKREVTARDVETKQDETSGEWWEVYNVKKLPGIAESGGPFPNEVEPSDHILIATDLQLVSGSVADES